eukprot:976519_1
MSDFDEQMRQLLLRQGIEMQIEQMQQPFIDAANARANARPSSEPQPNGQRFILETPGAIKQKRIYDKQKRIYDRQKQRANNPQNNAWVVEDIFKFVGFIVVIVVIGSGLVLGFKNSNWMLGGTLIGLGSVIVIIVCCCSTDDAKEQWLTYVMIFDTNSAEIYLISESTAKRWKIDVIIPFNKLKSIDTHMNRRTYSYGIITYSETEKAFVSLRLFGGRKMKFNKIACSILAVRTFVNDVENYMNYTASVQIKQNSQLMNIDGSLQNLIRKLKLNDDENIVNNGMKLDFWYERKPGLLQKEYEYFK